MFRVSTEGKESACGCVQAYHGTGLIELVDNLSRFRIDNADAPLALADIDEFLCCGYIGCGTVKVVNIECFGLSRGGDIADHESILTAGNICSVTFDLKVPEKFIDVDGAQDFRLERVADIQGNQTHATAQCPCDRTFNLDIENALPHKLFCYNILAEKILV